MLKVTGLRVSLVLLPALALACSVPVKSAAEPTEEVSDAGGDDGSTIRNGTAPDDSADGGAPLVDAAPPVIPDIPAAKNWIDEVNLFRKAAKLSDIEADDSMNAGAVAHAKYIVMNDEVTHFEKKDNQHYSPEGEHAGMVSDILGTDRAGAFDTSIEFFAKAPFHAIQILNPALKSTGYGEFTSRDGGGYIYAAVLNVRDGLDAKHVEPATSFPILFPADGALSPIREAVNEYPNPLAPCAGYTYPAGLPIVVQLAPGKSGALKSSLMLDGKAVEHCVFDQKTYTNKVDPAFSKDETAEQHGQNILKAANAVIILPRKPLTRSGSYKVSLTVGADKIDWGFKVANTAR